MKSTTLPNDSIKDVLRKNVNHSVLSCGLITSNKQLMSCKTTNRVKLIRYYEDGCRSMLSNQFQRAALTSCGLGYMYNQILRVDSFFGKKTTYLQFGNPHVDENSVSKYSHNRTETENVTPAVNCSAITARLLLGNNISGLQTREPFQCNENFTVSLFGISSFTHHVNEPKQITNQTTNYNNNRSAIDIVQHTVLNDNNISFNCKNKKNHEFPGTSTTQCKQQQFKKNTAKLEPVEDHNFFLVQYHGCNRFNVQRASFHDIERRCAVTAAIGKVAIHDPIYESVMGFLSVIVGYFFTKRQKIKACQILEAVKIKYALINSQRQKYNVPLIGGDELLRLQSIDFCQVVFEKVCTYNNVFYFKNKKNSFNTLGPYQRMWYRHEKRPCWQSDCYMQSLKRYTKKKHTKCNANVAITDNNGCEPYDFKKWCQQQVQKTV